MRQSEIGIGNKISYYKNIKIIVITCGLILLPLMLLNPANVEAKLLFKTGFEGGVTLSTPKMIGGRWWQDISYKEGPSTTGRLPGNGYKLVMFLVDTSAVPSLQDLTKYVRSEIQLVNGPENGTSMAWLMHNINHYTNGPPYYTGQRISLNVEPGITPPDNLEELYIQYDMKFIPEFNSSMTTNSWDLLWENSVNGNTNKLMVIRTTANSPLFWKLESHTDVPIYNKTNEIPLNRWFKLGIYYKHSIKNDGKITVFVDNIKIFDYIGSTADTGGVYAMNILKSYSNVKNVGHWVDNLEIHDSINLDNTGQLRKVSNIRVFQLSGN